MRAACHRHRQHQMLGDPDGFETQLIGALGELGPQRRMGPSQTETDFIAAGSPTSSTELPQRTAGVDA